MAATIPASEPARLRAGDTWTWTRDLPDYPAGGWVLKYAFRNPAKTGWTITATASGVRHVVNVAALTTAGYEAGEWQWIAYVEGGGEKFTVGAGVLVVEPDYRAGTAALDDRSHARKVLAAIEAWLENHDPAVAEYEIAGRRMKYIPIGELLKLRDRYRAEVAREDDAARLSAGLPSRRKLLVRFGPQ